MKKSIIFMGTPDFSVPTLKRLIELEDYNVSLVVTQPDRPAGRGQKIQSPPVKLLAEENGLKCIQPQSMRTDEEARKIFFETPCDFLVVIAFGQILPVDVLQHAKTAPLNIHASLLPAYRGAAPIQRAIIEGDTTTGVSVQWMVKELDMGDILFRLPCKLEDSDTSQSLHDRLRDLAPKAIESCLGLFKAERINRTQQDPRIGSYANKLEKSEALLNFSEPANVVHRKIMGLNPWPVAECQLAGQRLRIFRSRFVPRENRAEPGSIVEVNENEIIVGCGQACIAILEVQMENRKRLEVSEFLKGFPLQEGQVLGGRS